MFFRISLSVLGIWTLASYANVHPANETSPIKVIIDTDFNTIGDDGQTLALAAQMHASKDVEIMGLTIVAGNQYLEQGVSDALKAVERVGLENTVGVYIGAENPFLHDYNSFQLEKRLFGNATQYAAAYTSPKSQQLVPPPDGFAVHTVPKQQHAVDFIIESVHRYPGQITLLAIGPLTNVALAIRKDPSIVPLIKQTVIMGSQIYAAGNAYRGAGETNWWFDPESASVVLRADIVKKIIPLDVTNTVPITNETYDVIANYTPATPITSLFRDIERWGYVYDTIALASLVDPSLDIDVRDLYVEVNSEFSEEYGKGVVWDEDPYPGTNVETVSSVVFRINNTRFFDLYVDLLTRPVPVQGV
ncbi:inosine/uridine-preferring nucleoside hydrolase [Byssothecium circinans]|uniref:Inosine/uridine-preferring nucleoside hydrolase n=1 Tax=Byssothecium circinans TaxID=147558 RepID=A0A6A5TFW6_9PLEO|nr:inosine/uridine-preferring nucleoside hydrolase [Byssothecium circinans]